MFGPSSIKISFLKFVDFCSETFTGVNVTNSMHFHVSIETAPVFTSPSPDGSTIVFVGENEPSGNTILTLAASDDEGDTVTFAVIGQHNEVFECHNSDVILKRSLDYEMERFFLISIMCVK